EDLLGEVLGLVLRLEDGAREPVDEAAVAIVERSERGAVGGEPAEQHLVRGLGRGRLLLSNPSQVEVLVTIVGRRGGSHTSRLRPSRALGCRGRQPPRRGHEPGSYGAFAPGIAARETSGSGGSAIGPTGVACPLARSTV